MEGYEAKLRLVPSPLGGWVGGHGKPETEKGNQVMAISMSLWVVIFISTRKGRRVDFRYGPSTLVYLISTYKRCTLYCL